MIFCEEEKMIDFIAQAIGIVAAAISISSFQFKNNKILFALRAISSVLFAANYFLIGAMTAAILNAINIACMLLMLYGERHRYIAIPIGLSATYIIAVCFTYEGILSLLLLVAQLSCVISMWTADGLKIRLAQLFIASPIWLVNNIIVFTIGGIVTEIFAIVSVLVSIARFGIKGLCRTDEPSEAGAECPTAENN
jgi:hypothetical protein